MYFFACITNTFKLTFTDLQAVGFRSKSTMINLFLSKAKIIIYRNHLSFVDKYFFSRLTEGFSCIVSGNVFHS